MYCSSQPTKPLHLTSTAVNCEHITEGIKFCREANEIHNRNFHLHFFKCFQEIFKLRIGESALVTFVSDNLDEVVLVVI